MKIIIIGNGRVGSVLSRLLLGERNIKLITCCDLEIKNRIKNKKINYKRIDAGLKNQLFKLFRNTEADLVVNASLPVFNANILEICLGSKTNYLDLNSYWDFDPNPKSKSPYKVEQLDYDSKFKQAGLFGLINAGVSPGLTNLLAKQSTEYFDRIDRVKIRLYEDTGSEELFFAWSKKWTLDEIYWKPLVWRKEKFQLRDNFSDEEEYNFPKPYGRKKVCLISQEEVSTVPLFIKTKNLDIKSFDNQLPVSKLLLGLDLLSEEKVKVNGRIIIPQEIISEIIPDTLEISHNKNIQNAIFGMVVDTEGKKDGKPRRIKQSVFFPFQKEVDKLGLGGGANFISYPTALMAKLFISSRPFIRKKGIIPPEALDEKARRNIFHGLGKRGVRIENFLSEKNCEI